MSNVPIITYVTKEQLDALVTANGLNPGLQYQVTDKDWLLTAETNNSLFASNNILTLIAGDIFPSYITCDRLLIDTGLIVTDISSTPTEIPYPLSFYFSRAFVNSNVDLDALELGAGSPIINISDNTIFGGSKQALLPPSIVYNVEGETVLYLTATVDSGSTITDGFRLVAEFIKSPI